MIKCRFFYMRIILLTFLLLFNYSGYVTSCPSSGDGDCVPSKDTYDKDCLLYTSPSPRDGTKSRMPSSA